MSFLANTIARTCYLVALALVLLPHATTADVVLKGKGGRETTVPCTSDHVIIVGVDGLASNIVWSLSLPNIENLCATGACTLRARPHIPSVSMPNWVSHLFSATPEVSGITSFNDTEGLEPQGGALPMSLFAAAKHQNPSLKCAVFCEWAALSRKLASHADHVFPPPDERDVFEATEDLEIEAIDRYETEIAHRLVNATTAAEVKAILKEHKKFVSAVSLNSTRVVDESYLKGDRKMVDTAMNHRTADGGRSNLTFIYLGATDEMGHHYGWSTPQYTDAVKLVDELVGEIVSKLQNPEEGWGRWSLMLITDHGGLGTTHGGHDRLPVMETPWIMNSPSCVIPHRISMRISPRDTSPHVMRLLGLRPHPDWRGRTVTAPFRDAVQSEGGTKPLKTALERFMPLDSVHCPDSNEDNPLMTACISPTSYP